MGAERRRLGAAAALLAAALGAAGSLPAGEAAFTGLEYLGSAELPRGLAVAGEPVGGLSGLVWDTAGDEWLALSDDRSERAPARFYRLRVDLADGRLDSGDVTVVSAVHLADRDGRPFAPKSLDPEGIALAGDRLFLSSEGDTHAGQAAFVAEAGRDGRVRRFFELPERFLPAPPGAPARGVRFNLGFESLAVTPDGRFLFAGTENALAQDGPAADVGVPSVSRILRFPLSGDEAPREWAYRVDGVRQPAAEGTFRVNGLADLIALGPERLLALEREFVAGGVNIVRLYDVSLAGAAEVSAIDDLSTILPATKTLVVDFEQIRTIEGKASGRDFQLDNLEGMALGPRLPDGRRLMLVVADDNFAAPHQRTLLLAFAADEEPVTISRIQGAGHRSPLEGRWVAGVEGVVTALGEGQRPKGFWVESPVPDSDPATSEGLFVETDSPPTLAPGAALSFNGKIVEAAPNARQLSSTRLVLSGFAERGAGRLRPPPRLFRDRVPPVAVDDDRDGFARFEPERDALDFWESLEGMRVEVGPGTVVGATREFGELVLLADGVQTAARTAAGGVRLEPAGPPPGRVTLSGRLTGGLPDLRVGARVRTPTVGIVDYGFSTYRVLALGPLGARCANATRLAAAPGRPTLATFNVENLSVAGPPERFSRLAEIVVRALGSPVLVSLEEIQDDSGPADDGTVSSRRTVDALVQAIQEAGGPRYDAAWVDPEDGREGGQPGGNIRVVLLFDPLRATLHRRGDPGPLDPAVILSGATGPALSINPGRVSPTSAAFTLPSGEGVRRSLAIELEVDRRPLFLVLNHWSSKFSDDRDFGGVQPPAKPTAAQRLAQAKEIRAWVDGLLRLDPEARVVVAGDLNDFEWTPALAAIAAPPLENLILRVPEPERYTYNFEGGSQVLDHVIVSPALARGAQIELVHLDSDCPDVLRASDHDPIVVRFDLRR